MKLLNSIFNDKYYRIKQFERNGRIYEILGIRWFKRLLLKIAGNRKNDVPFNGYFLKEMSKEGIIAFENRTKKSERSHVMIGLLILLYQVRIFIFLEGMIDVFFLLFFTVMNVIANIYSHFFTKI